MSERTPIEVAKAVTEWFLSIPYAEVRAILLESRGFDAATAEFESRGYGSIAELVDPEVVIGTGGFTGAAVLPSGAGRDVFLRYWRAWYEPWSDLRIKEERYEQVGDSVIVEARLSLRGDLSGAAVEVELCQLYTVRDGRIVAYQAYESRERALAAIEAANGH